MSIGVRVAEMLAAASIPLTPLSAQGMPSGMVGCYNGDWKRLIASVTNWHTSDTQFAHLYDDFVVPEGGRTVRGVFGQAHLRATDVQQAYWEIRSGVSQGNGGWVAASGLKAATTTRIGTVAGGIDVYWLRLKAAEVASLNPKRDGTCMPSPREPSP